MKVASYYARYGRWYEKIIAIYTLGPFSHSEIVFSDGQWFSSSPRDGGVRYKKINPKPDHWEFIEIPITEQQEERMRRWCDRQVGLPYDWYGVFRFAFPWLSRSQHRRKWFCSEISIASLQRAQILRNVKPYRMCPNKLYRLLYPIFGEE